MGELNYSSEALNVLSKFHRKKYVVFVEGDDDVPFWQTIFQAFNMKHFILKPAGGASEIEKYTHSILTDNAEIYVARDSDFKELLDQQLLHPRILWTFGYSIENTLFHPRQIAEIISIYSRAQTSDTSKAEEWLQNFANEFWTLLVYEIGNEKYQKGMEVLGKKCSNFLNSSKSCMPSKELIQQKIDDVYSKLTNEEYTTVEELLKASISKKPLYFIIRGHFLTNAVINFVKSEVKKEKSKKITLSEDNLFANLIGALKSECITNADRDDLKHLKSQLMSWA